MSIISDEIKTRFKEYRVASSVTQKELSDKSGVSVRSISRFENGEDISLEAFIKLMETMGLGEKLKLLIPDQRKRPSYYLQNEKRRKRATKKKQEKHFVWGDEK